MAGIGVILVFAVLGLEVHQAIRTGFHFEAKHNQEETYESKRPLVR